MILSKLFSRYKNNWLKKREEDLWKEFESSLKILKDRHYLELSQYQKNCDETMLIASDKFKEIEEQLEKRRTVLEYEKKKVSYEEDNNKHLEKLVEQKRIELERVREELKLQIRIMEAKSSPEQVWTSAFESGFSKAWAMMVPVITDGLDKQKEMIRNKAIEETRKRLEPFVKPNGR